MAYDAKFRERVIRYKDSGHTFAQVHEAFGVDSKRYYVWKKQLAENGKFENHYPATHPGRIDPEKLKELVDEHPDWFLREFAEVFGVSTQAVQKRFVSLKITRKKKTFTYTERSEEARAAYVEELKKIPENRRAYVDECGIREDLKREHGRALRGKKVEDTKRGRAFHRVNVVAAEKHGKNGVRRIAPLCYQGTMTGERFEAWFKHHLLKAVRKGDTIIMDNARFHRKKVLAELCAIKKVHLLFLPPYSPDFNPIEKSWANMKSALMSFGLSRSARSIVSSHRKLSFSSIGRFLCCAFVNSVFAGSFRLNPI
jgi:transposase